MKFKHLIVVSLILAILTIGVVSASEDVACNDTLSESSADDGIITETAPESSDDVVSQSDDVDEDVLSYSDEEPVIGADNDPKDVLGDYSSGGVEIVINNYMDISDKYGELGYVYDDGGLKGTITVNIDGTKVFSKKFTNGNRYSYYIDTGDLDLKKIGYGYHNVKITYNDGKDKSDSRKVNFVAIPEVDYPSKISVGENNGISIKGEKGFEGTATIYNRTITGHNEYNEPTYSKGNALVTVKITDGFGWIPLNTLTNGSYNLQLEYTFGTYEDVQTFNIEVRKNSDGFVSSLSKTTITFGKSITAKLTGPKAEGYANIYVDNKYFKSVRFNFGVMEETIQELSVGKHLVTISYYDYDSDLFYSKTYNVVVNHDIKLKLPKVKVKKSAKKLTIKATLKIDGKAAKKTKVKFKFNNKKYTAKTDSQGVAKITIKKKILKKLKKGKKVQYEVSYGGKTVKQKVKVKK
jgi:uncharacterized protein YneR